MSAKLQAPPIRVSQVLPFAVLWAVLAILLAAAVAVGAFVAVRSADDTAGRNGSARITSERPATPVSDTSLVKAGLQPAPFSPVGAGAADLGGSGPVGRSPQQR